jgi:PAS domain S-box-containing protein
VHQKNEIHYRLDVHGNFTFLNEAGERILGYSSSEARQMNVMQVVAPDVSPQIREQVQKTSREPLGGVYEIDLITKSGRRITLELSTSQVIRDGQPAEIHGFAVPVCSVEQMIRERPRCLDPYFFAEVFV